MSARSGINGKKLQVALQHLTRADADLRRALKRVGPPPPRHRPAGFETLLWIIVGQQISIKAADAIWNRLVAAVDPLSPPGLLRCGESGLREIGFSRQKIKYGLGLAEMIIDRRLDLAALESLPDDAAIAAIAAVPGLGRWSAEIYLLSSLDRPDVMPADDLALLAAAQRVKGLAQRPTPKALRAMAESWRPWRSVAARLLWHYYRMAPADSMAARKTKRGAER
jgi:DNA-3-methyladenine glycosylase II